MNNVKIIFALLIVSMLLSSVAWGELHIVPTLSLREEYNDNIFLERDKESDFITFVQPSLLFDWNTKLFDLSLDLGLVYEKYLHHSDEDDLRPSSGSQLESIFSLYRDVLFLRVSDTYERVPIDDSEKGGVGNQLVNLTDSNRLMVNPYLLFKPLRTLQARFDYKYENIWYQDDAGDDAEYHHYIATLTQELSPRISANLGGGYTQYRPRNASQSLLDDSGEQEYDRSYISLGLLWQINERLAMRGEVGSTWLDYEFSEDYDSPMYGAQIDYQLSRVFTLGAAYRDDISASVEEGAKHDQKYSAYLSYSDRSTVKLGIFQSRDKYLETDRRDDSWGVTLNGETPLTNKKGLIWLLSYTDYEEQDLRDYDRIGGRIEFYHQLRTGRLSCGYTYNRSNSSLNDEDYNNNIVFIQLALTW